MQRCSNHPELPAAIDCARCGKFLCAHCIADPRRKLCLDCDERVFELVMALATRKSAVLRLVGGLFAGLSGVGLLTWLVSDGANQTQGQFFGRLTLGFSLSVLSLVIVIFAARSWWRVRVPLSDRTARSLRPPPVVAMSPDELIAEAQRVNSTGRSLLACLNCRLVLDTAPCARCKSTADTLEVRNAEDLRMLRAAVET